jgi:hypothetical protein
VPCCGLGSHGLITQIEKIKKAGKQTETYVHDGKKYVRYEYEDLPTEIAIVKLSVEYSLPVWWHSVIYDPNKKIAVSHVIFEDLQANGAIPEELFEPPADVTFVEKDFGEVMRPKEDDQAP